MRMREALGWHVWHGGDRLHPDDLPNQEHFDSVGFFGEEECEEFAGCK